MKFFSKILIGYISKEKFQRRVPVPEMRHSIQLDPQRNATHISQYEKKKKKKNRTW